MYQHQLDERMNVIIPSHLGDLVFEGRKGSPHFLYTPKHFLAYLVVVYGPAHKSSVYAHIPLINTHPDMSSQSRGLNFSLSLHIHPYFV